MKLCTKQLIAVLIIILISVSSGQEINTAVQNGDFAKVKELVENDVSKANFKDAAGRMPAHYAANADNLEIFKYLLSKGADIKAKTNAGTTVLHYAALSGNLEIAKIAVEKGLELEAKNNQIATALYYAAMQGNNEVVKYLAEKGADVDPVDREEGTPIHTAANRGHFETVKLLISLGCNKNKVDTNGLTVMHFACRNGNSEMIEYLINKGLNIEKPDNYGKLPIHYAAESGHNDAVEILLSKGIINPDAVSNDGATLLHSAALGGLVKFAGNLIEKGAEINKKNIFGQAPIHFAAIGGKNNVIEILIKNGADINLKNNAGQTAYNIAAANNHTQTVEFLASNGAEKTVYNFIELKSNYIDSNTPGRKARLFAPGIISTGTTRDRDVSFSKDFTEFYYTKNGVIHEMKKKDGKWTPAVPTSFTGNNASFEAYFTPDDQKIYFISNRPKSGTGNPGTWEIWFVERQGKNWSKPELLGSPFEGCFYTTFTDNWIMYYTGEGGDLYRAKYENGKFLTPERLSDNINTPSQEYNSFIARDESYFIFTSHGMGKDFGGGDLYISFRKNDGTWTKAVNMGPEINSWSREYCPSVSPDGKYLFFTSGRYGGDDIFWISAKIIEDLKKQHLR